MSYSINELLNELPGSDSSEFSEFHIAIKRNKTITVHIDNCIYVLILTSNDKDNSSIR